MAVQIHVFDVGLGNMTLIKFPNGTTWLYDCNVTEQNEADVFAYLRRAMGTRRRLGVFICSHRDADHMRGCRKVHRLYPMSVIRDADVPGTTTDSREYREYMDLRRDVGSQVIKRRTFQDVGDAKIRWMNAKDSELSGANDQSIVMKIAYKGSSFLSAADTSYKAWRDSILPFYSRERLKSNILLGSHHGSSSFFDDPPSRIYERHMERIRPAMTLLSVGSNNHGLPTLEALRLYRKHSTGSNKGKKIRRTDRDGNMKLTLKDDGRWSLSVNQ